MNLKPLSNHFGKIQFFFFAKLCKIQVFRSKQFTHCTARKKKGSVTAYVWLRNSQLFPQNSLIWISIISKLPVQHVIRKNNRKNNRQSITKVCTILVWYYIEGADQENESVFCVKNIFFVEKTGKIDVRIEFMSRILPQARFCSVQTIM